MLKPQLHAVNLIENIQKGNLFIVINSQNLRFISIWSKLYYRYKWFNALIKDFFILLPALFRSFSPEFVHLINLTIQFWKKNSLIMFLLAYIYSIPFGCYEENKLLFNHPISTNVFTLFNFSQLIKSNTF